MRSKRTVTLVAVAGLFSGVACSSGGAPDQGPRSHFTDDEALAARAACTFTAGTLPGLSLGKSAPIGTQIPIDTIVILMMENRSFDHLLGNLVAYGQPDADVAPAGATNPDATGKPVARFHDSAYCFSDTNHGWADTHTEWNGGKNDGFVVANGHDDAGNVIDGTRAMGYYTEADVPFLYGVASTFSVADRAFASVLGPTFPNREYLYAATSFGRTDNQLFSDDRATLVDALAQAKISFRVYHETLPGIGIFLNTYTRYLDNVLLLDGFFTDAKAGTLPQVSFVDPNLRDDGAARDDFHPPGDVQLGDQFLAKVVSALIASPQWPHTALFVTFDENGGTYDHVAPPAACPPDAITPMLAPGDPAAAFDHLGFRVPFLVVSPYARAHSVSHATYDHTSIVRFVETRFRLPALTARDANATPPLEMFDFGKPALLSPPKLPGPIVDDGRLATCKSEFPPPSVQTGPDAAAPVDAGARD